MEKNCENCLRHKIIDHLKTGIVYIHAPQGGQVHTYGELAKDAYTRMFDNFEGRRGCFIDLGAGTGRGLLYAIANGFCKAKGVEIVKERVDYGNEHIILPLDSLTGGRATLSHGSILDLREEYFSEDEGGVVIWWGNLCFPVEERETIWSHLHTCITESTVVFCSRPPANCEQWVVIKTISDVPQTWTKHAVVYALKKTNVLV